MARELKTEKELQHLILQRLYEVTGKHMTAWRRIIRTGPPADRPNWLVLDLPPGDQVREAIDKLREEYDMERPR